MTSQRKVNCIEDLRKIREWEHLSQDVREVLVWAYGLYAKGKVKTDGITWISQLGFYKSNPGGNRFPEYPGHPAGLGHDCLYRFRMWPKGEVCSRKEADQWFKDCLNDFGYPNFAKIWHRGLRIFGWVPWLWRNITGGPSDGEGLVEESQ